MEPWRALPFLLLLAAAQAVAQEQVPTAATDASTDALAGLWKAQRNFGPNARGSLVIQKTQAGWVADFVGHNIQVSADKDQLAFKLPNGQGEFDGELQSNGEIHGHWSPPDSQGLQGGSGNYVSSVRLLPDGPMRWRGEIRPFDDIFTFFLLATKRPDGALGTLLINPERDYGSRLGPDRMLRKGNAVELIADEQGKPAEVVVSGNYDPENDTITLQFPGRGGSYDFKRDDDQSDFYPRGKHPAQYTYSPPLGRDDDWPTATLDEVDIDQAGIERMVQLLIDAPAESADTPKIHGVLIARHGKLVLEEYFHGEHRDKLHETRSAAKSMTATIIGAAMLAGVPVQLSSPVYKVMNGGTFPADLEPRKRAMTLENLLTMSSGFFCDDTNPDAPGNEDAMSEQTEEPDLYRLTMKVPMASAPGEKAVYCSCNPNLALGVVSRAAGESPFDLFDRLVAYPMKIERYGWGRDSVGHAYGGGGMQLLPRDFMKFGQLMLNDGVWDGHRILSHEFVERASAPLYHLRGLYYGYFWWSTDFPYKDRMIRGFYAGGAGGQLALVFPELDLVIATFGGNYSSTGTFFTGRTLVPRDLLPAVREAGDDRHAPVVPRKDFAPRLGPTTESGPIAHPN